MMVTRISGIGAHGRVAGSTKVTMTKEGREGKGRRIVRKGRMERMEREERGRALHLRGLRMVVSFALPTQDLGVMATVGWFIAVR